MQQYLGKILGGLFGYLFAGSIGAVFGIIIGHFFDKALLRPIHRYASNGDSLYAQQVFFNTTFAVMGHIAKSDGRVSEKEIQVARKVMDRLGLNESQKQKAIQLFTQGKQPSFDLENALFELLQACRHQRVLLQIFLEIQAQAVFADRNYLHTHKQRVFMIICQRLGAIPPGFTYIESLFGKWQNPNASYRYERPPQASAHNALQDAYALLGIDEAASNVEVKRAYRRLMSQNHPDKLIAKGLPKEMLKMATEKTQSIKAAYEKICTARGIA